jgi:NTP pyrophosphatase (non-canonical NTP hydrolase)
MEMGEAHDMARRTRALYRTLERAKYGREWDLRDLYIGFTGDVGDLGKLIGAYEGVRPGPDDVSAAIGHELADCLWSILLIADGVGIDLEAAYRELDADLTSQLGAKLSELGIDPS